MPSQLGNGLFLGAPQYSGGGGGAVPALALRDRFGDPILDRFGAYILTRV